METVSDMQTDLDRALWNVVDKKSYKEQTLDAARCIEAGANVNCQRPYKKDPSTFETPILIAIFFRETNLVRRLLELGADPNSVTYIQPHRPTPIGV